MTKQHQWHLMPPPKEVYCSPYSNLTPYIIVRCSAKARGSTQNVVVPEHCEMPTKMALHYIEISSHIFAREQMTCTYLWRLTALHTNPEALVEWWKKSPKQVVLGNKPSHNCKTCNYPTTCGVKLWGLLQLRVLKSDALSHALGEHHSVLFLLPEEKTLWHHWNSTAMT